jgi:hypothetical protein
MGFTACRRIGTLVRDHPCAGFLQRFFPGCVAHDERATSFDIVGQYRRSISVPFHFAKDHSAISQPHSETLDGQIALVRDLTVKDFWLHPILDSPA